VIVVKKKESEVQNQKSKTQNHGYGTLYVVSTPIGNMEDITLRALKVLKDADIIAAESSAHTRGLCQKYEIETVITSYNQHNQKKKASELIKRLKSGQDVAIVTNAGTPGISDPGIHLVNLAANEGITITPIPGPSAVIAALSVSGMPSEAFLFLGFLPNKSAKRRKALVGLIAETRTMVFFEAPHRIREMLEELREFLGDRKMVMLREITKVFEDVKRGTISTILEHLTPDTTRGEFTLVVAGKEIQKDQCLSQAVMIRIENLLAKKTHSVKNIAELISKEEEIPYRQTYKACLERKRHLEKVGADGSC